ncbi:MAG: hypothetical protein P8J50_09070 [Acidimicrobiales bacterium]|jgi:hypothetical protein|nr:hypothetical protein [Acidimicrobiales bacterium]
MPKYGLAYHTNGGGPGHMPEGEEAMAEMMNAWQSWFASLGENLLNGGNPITFAKTIGSHGSVSDGGGSNPLTGYGIVQADNIDAAVDMAKGCPALANDGNVEVAEAIDM